MPQTTSIPPTILVILGITGDLAAKKILPALSNLSSRGQLPPQFKIVGFGRREWTDADLQKYAEETLIERKFVTAGDAHLPAFLARLSHQQVEFSSPEGYEALAKHLGMLDGQWQACSNKLFYLSVPPEQYEVILRQLHASGLTKPCGGEDGWTRVLIEKPFGQDQTTAEELDMLLGKLFQEEQIYRIDHYLAKEMLQNILTFRFGNDLFEDLWDNRCIESIEIRLWETLGVEARGAFYDKVGTLRDVGQNHLLQMLALATMDKPKSLSAADIRSERARLLGTLRVPTPEQVATQTVRAQYDGYRAITGVAPDSRTETYFRTTVYLDDPRWKDIPIYLESGKRMKSRRKEMVVTFREHNAHLFPDKVGHKNKVTFSIEPEEGISVDLWAKKPGLDYTLEPRNLSFLLRGAEAKSQYVEEYEKLLVDSMLGDQTLFVSTGEVQAMWRIIDPIVAAWQADTASPMATYAPDTDDAAQLSM
jgi:glucose-6-phosphate 1-dehydrogenase